MLQFPTGRRSDERRQKETVIYEGRRWKTVYQYSSIIARYILCRHMGIRKCCLVNHSVTVHMRAVYSSSTGSGI